LVKDEVNTSPAKSACGALVTPLFIFLGTVSLIIVCAVLISLSWRLSLLTIPVTIPLWLEEFSGFAGILAVSIQLFLFLSGLHRKWIFARFMAERMRLWKYQLLLDGEFVSKGAFASAEQFNEELHARWVVFYENFKHGIGGMNVFGACIEQPKRNRLLQCPRDLLKIVS
jgi:hypothetical protein